MPANRLTQRRVDALEARKKVYDIRDGELRGFGVRVLPSGHKHYFLHTQVRGRRTWKRISDTDAMTLTRARDRAKSILAAQRNGDDGIVASPDETLFEIVADEVFRRYSRNWKPRTLKVNLGYYRNQILPWFRGHPIAGITAEDVRRWFASLHATPVSADRSAPVLSVIMRQAEGYGYRPEGGNPCAGIKRYRRQGRERFLTADEMRRLGKVLDRHQLLDPLKTAAVRLLLLTGCRKSEILTLKWSDYRECNLYLRDSKTGPRTVWLSSHARKVLDALPRKGPWVFPGSRTDRPVHDILYFWHRVRKEAAIVDVRLHDLRHTYASAALAHGETVLTIGRLLGHNDPATTLKYTHLADAAVRNAVEAVSTVLEGRS